MPSYVRQFWGKSRPVGETGPAWHSLAWHSLDVAAVAAVLLQRDEGLARSLASALGLSLEDVRWVVPLLIALHDLGKFADSFQRLNAPLMREMQGEVPVRACPYRHDTLGYLLAMALVPGQFPFLQADSLLRAVTGHHGRPPSSDAEGDKVAWRFSPAAQQAAAHFVADLAQIFPGSAIPATPGRGSWMLAGLTVLCDWVGSHQSFFPYCTDEMPLSYYWEQAQLRAEDALREMGLRPCKVSAWAGLTSLFPGLVHPTPVQQYLSETFLLACPQMWILEERTGGGKTEAALGLAHRLMGLGLADGLFIALPTMATANALQERIRPMHRRLYVEGESPSFILSHSASDALAAWLPPVLDQGEEGSAGQDCSDWLADNRKKALLAHVGVGTIDQALLGVLPVRHAMLRLVGLSRKVLIVDEVHAYDAYMMALLERLLFFHASQGGSAILLSATLPRGLRQQLVNAYRSGLGASPHPVQSMAYPLLTQVGVQGVSEHEPPTEESAQRRVGLRHYSTISGVLAELEATVNAGGCAAWIRNTVRDAQEAFEMAKALGMERVFLFHARYTLRDRLNIEREMQRRFGRSSSPCDRRGWLVIATQVIEQSLDLDFDFLVSDLAPIDLLLQRMGRLWRHMRPERTGRALFGLLSPLWRADPPQDWVERQLPGTAAVYRHVGRLWRTLDALRGADILYLPCESRALVESVYGSRSEDLPEGLRTRSLQIEREEGKHGGQGRLAALHWGDAYSGGEGWSAEVETRLGAHQALWELARKVNGREVPLRGTLGLSEADQWRQNQVAIPCTRLAPQPRTRWGPGRLVMTPDGALWRGEGRGPRGERVAVMYDDVRGLFLERR